MAFQPAPMLQTSATSCSRRRGRGGRACPATPSTECSASQHTCSPAARGSRREALLVLTSGASLTRTQSASAAYEDFFTTSSGLKILDLIANPESSTPVSKGDTVRVHYSGYTLGYQAKRFENTSLSDEPFVFTIGSGDAIPAFVRRSLAHAPSRNPGVSCHRR